MQLSSVQVQNSPLVTMSTPPPPIASSVQKLSVALKAKLITTFGSSMEVLLANVKSQKSWYDLARVILPRPKPVEFPESLNIYKPLMPLILQAALDVNLDDPEVGARVQAEIVSLLRSGSVAPIIPPLSPLIPSFSVASSLPSLPPPPPYLPSPPVEFSVAPPPSYSSLGLPVETRPVPPTPRQRVQREYKATKFMCGLYPQDVGRFGVLLSTPAPFALIISDLISYDLMEDAVQGISLVIGMARANPDTPISATILTAFIQALNSPNNPQLLGRQAVLTELNKLLLNSLSGTSYTYNSLRPLTIGSPPTEVNPLDRIDFLITHILLGIRGGILPLYDGTFQPTEFPFLFAPTGLIQTPSSERGVVTPALSDHLPLYRQNTLLGSCFSWNVSRAFTVNPQFTNNGFAAQEQPLETQVRMQAIFNYLRVLVQVNPDLNVISLQETGDIPISIPHPSNPSALIMNPAFQILGFTPINLADGKLILIRNSVLQQIGPIEELPGKISCLQLLNTQSGQVCRFLAAHLDSIGTKFQNPYQAEEAVAGFIRGALYRQVEVPAVFMGDLNEELSLLRYHLSELPLEGNASGSWQSAYFPGQQQGNLVDNIVTEEARSGVHLIRPGAFEHNFYAVINNVDACIVYNPGADKLL